MLEVRKERVDGEWFVEGLIIGPNLAKLQNVAKETLSDLSAGLQHAPAVRFAHSTTYFASIPLRFCRGLHLRDAQNFAPYVLCELSGCLPGRCRCEYA